MNLGVPNFNGNKKTQVFREEINHKEVRSLTSDPGLVSRQDILGLGWC